MNWFHHVIITKLIGTVRKYHFLVVPCTLGQNITTCEKEKKNRQFTITWRILTIPITFWIMMHLSFCNAWAGPYGSIIAIYVTPKEKTTLKIAGTGRKLQNQARIHIETVSSHHLSCLRRPYIKRRPGFQRHNQQIYPHWSKCSAYWVRGAVSNVSA